uniref:Uncharacterized protein n=1 Tax=Lepeophtheirus salmonis TaxID=72036 RepID=A0A0K2V940_LEPSM
MKGKMPQQTQKTVVKHYMTLHLQLEQLISGFKIFRLAILVQVTLMVLNALLSLLLQKLLIKPMIW